MNGAKIAKNISYVLVPIVAVFLVVATLGTAIVDENIIVTESDYYIVQVAKGLSDITKNITPFFIPVSVVILIILVNPMQALYFTMGIRTTGFFKPRFSLRYFSGFASYRALR